MAVVAALFLSMALTLPAVADVHTVTLETTHGDIVLELDETRAPVTVANFLDYVDDGFYDQTIFHRVIEGFMIQGGGFTSAYQRKATRSPITNEANNGLSNERYTIAMARTNSPHSATAQFFINTVDNRNLDHSSPTARGWGYTVFGRVVDGNDVVQRISEVATGAGGPFSSDVPREPVIIERAYRNDGDGETRSGDGASQPTNADKKEAVEPALGASDEESSSRVDVLEHSGDGSATI